jgi:hypothetical protein
MTDNLVLLWLDRLTDDGTASVYAVFPDGSEELIESLSAEQAQKFPAHWQAWLKIPEEAGQ